MPAGITPYFLSLKNLLLIKIVENYMSYFKQFANFEFSEIKSKFSFLFQFSTLMWLIASIFYAYQYILRVMPNIMLDDIMTQFNIGAATFGQFSGVYYIGYSLMHLPIGIMLDRFGPKKVMTVSILLTVVGMLPLIFAEYWVYPIFGRLLIGMGSSAAILGLFKIIRMSFREEYFSRMLSISVTIGLVGAIYGGAPVSYMSAALGYKAVVAIFALIGVILSVVTFLILPNIKEESTRSIKKDLKEVFSNWRVIWLCVFAGFMVGPLEGFADVWGSAFFKKVYNLDPTVAASLPSMIFIGMCFGAPILSMIADKVGNYLITIIFSGITMSLVFASFLIWHLSPELLSFNFLLVGVCCGYQILAIIKATTYVKEHVAGLTTAVANMIIMIFGYCFHTAIGTVINSMGGPQITDALVYGVSVIPVTLFFGSLGFVFLYLIDSRKRAVA